jgi:hypothetical protein
MAVVDSSDLLCVVHNTLGVVEEADKHKGHNDSMDSGLHMDKVDIDDVVGIHNQALVHNNLVGHAPVLHRGIQFWVVN